MSEQFPPPLPGSGGSSPEPNNVGSADTGSVPPPLPSDRGASAPPPLPGQGRVAGAPAAPTPAPVSEPEPMPTPPRLPDPGRLADPAILHTTEDTRTYPCPTCGGMLGFDPDVQGLKCMSCGTVVPLPAELQQPSIVGKRDLRQTMAAMARIMDEHPKSLEREIVCQSCGGHTLFTGSFTATRCPYCNTPIQRDDVQAARTRLAIDGVLPFQVSEKRAREEIEAWINGRWFAPNEFKKYRELGSFTSIYLAYFSYDAETITHYTGLRGINRYVQVRDGDQTRTEVHTDWYPASGTVHNAFADVTGLANTGLDEKKAQELEPWPMNLTRQYSPEFVAGHLSRTYDQDAHEVFVSRVEGRMEDVIDSTVRQDIGGDIQQVHSKNISWPQLAFSQLALPVWMLTVTFRNRPFQVLINGVTGEVQGQRPWSPIKIGALIAVILLVILVGFVLYRMYGGS